MNEMVNIGRMIREEREKRGLSLEYTAELCELSYKGLENIELGLSDPKTSTLMRIAKVLELDFGTLV